jgi:hypothetical protein
VNSNLLLEVLVPLAKPGLQIDSFAVDDHKRAEIVRILEHRGWFASHPSSDNCHAPLNQVGSTLKQALVSSAGTPLSSVRRPHALQNLQRRRVWNRCQYH